MQKIILASLLALFLVAAASARGPMLITPEIKRSPEPPAETREVVRSGIMLTYSRLGVRITCATCSAFITWNELFMYRYIIEKVEAREGAAL